MAEALSPLALFEPGHTLAWAWIANCTYPWEVLHEIRELIPEIGAALDPARYDRPVADVWIAKTASVAPTASITGPCIIGEDTEVRPGAYIRGAVLVGDGCVVGNSTELKNCILFDGVQVPHYNYVGDSLLGHLAHMGAGAVTSNVKSDKTPVSVHNGDEIIETRLPKLGAVLGDGAEIGCGAVLNPGTVICPRSSVYPLASVRGVVPPDSILKSGKGTELVRRT